MKRIASAAFLTLPGCAFPIMRREETAVYQIPGGALERLRRLAPNGHAVWQGGEILSRSGNDALFPVLSVTKSVAMLTVARAVTRGWLAADEVVDFPEWRGKARGRITLRHLLNSTAGLPPGDRELYAARPADKGLAALRLPVQRTPGSVFRYGPAPWELMGEFLKRRLPDHGTTLPSFLGETLGELGIRSGEWRMDGKGTPYLSTGLVCRLSDLGRLGFALADLASGHERAGVSAEVFKGLMAPGAANPMFSAGIWWNRLARMRGARAVEPERSLSGEKPPGFWKNACLHPSARAEWFALVGSGGTRVYVLPSASVVIAVARGGDRWIDAAMLRALTDG